MNLLSFKNTIYTIEELRAINGQLIIIFIYELTVCCAELFNWTSKQGYTYFNKCLKTAEFTVTPDSSIQPP